MGWTTTDLLERIRREGQLSPNDPDYTDDVLLDVATGVMLERFITAIVGIKQEYYDRYEDTSVVANQRAYAFSPRAFASALREVVFIDSSGNHWPLVPLSYMDSHRYANLTYTEPEAYTVEDDKILPLPTPSQSTGTLRLVYEYQPGVLVATSECMAITGGVATGVLTGTEPGWSTADSFDILKATNPFALFNADLTASAVAAGTSVTFTLADLDTTRLAVGDYVCLANESCIPQIPSALHQALAQASAAEVLDSNGDSQGASRLERRAAGAIARIRSIISPRVKGKQKKWINPVSPLRRGRGRSLVWDDGSV